MRSVFKTELKTSLSAKRLRKTTRLSWDVLNSKQSGDWEWAYKRRLATVFCVHSFECLSIYWLLHIVLHSNDWHWQWRRPWQTQHFHPSVMCSKHLLGYSKAICRSLSLHNHSWARSLLSSISEIQNPFLFHFTRQSHTNLLQSICCLCARASVSLVQILYKYNYYVFNLHATHHNRHTERLVFMTECNAHPPKSNGQKFFSA